MALRKPLSQKTTNAGHYDRWTCPACYNDLPTKSEGTFACPSCQHSIKCELDTQPICVATLASADDEED